MAIPTFAPTGVERTFEPDEIIVSKTDLAGRITYANRVFLRVCGYTEREILGQPHNCIRHPDMPRSVFKLLWDTVADGREIFAYVVNMAKGGDHYWVFAHVTPTFGPGGAIVGYHSNRRVAERGPREKAMDLYRLLLAEERRHANPLQATAAGSALLQRMLEQQGVPYDELVFSL